MRYYQGVRYVAPWKPAPSGFCRCLTCGRAWDDAKPTALTPAPSGRCPFETFAGHNAEAPSMADPLNDPHWTLEGSADDSECGSCGADLSDQGDGHPWHKPYEDCRAIRSGTLEGRGQ